MAIASVIQIAILRNIHKGCYFYDTTFAPVIIMAIVGRKSGDRQNNTRTCYYNGNNHP